MMVMQDNDKKQAETEYEKIETLFRKLIEVASDNTEKWETIGELILLRSSFLIERVLDGLKINPDTALKLLRKNNPSLTHRQKQERELLVAAIDNLIDFAAAEQWQMLEELPEDLDIEKLEEYRQICEKYNLRYALQENRDILYAAGIASWWLNVPEGTVVTFMTQGDERVRAWHLSHHGLSYPKNDFPAELIPPVEFGCRCYLSTEGFGSVYGSKGINRDKVAINPVFKESLAKGGRIFSEEHPYFKSVLPKEVLRVKKQLKLKFNIV